MVNICPTCEKDDQIKKVSTIVQNGISHSTGKIPVESSYIDSDGKKHSHINYEKFSSTQISSLAKALLPPPMPKLRKGTFLFVLGLIRTIIVIIVFLYISINNPSNPFNILVPIFVAHFFYEVVWYRKEVKVYKIDMPIWEKSIERWEQLYYCERDGLVYIPGERPAHISKTMEYLHWLPYKPSFFEKLLFISPG